MGIRWRFRVDTLEVSGSFGSGPLSVVPFCHRKGGGAGGSIGFSVRYQGELLGI